MCIFKPPKPPDVQVASNPVQPTIQNQAATQTGDLPKEQKIVDPDEAKSVEYGTSKKQSGVAAGQVTGTDQLKISLGDAGSDTAREGGLNV